MIKYFNAILILSLVYVSTLALAVTCKESFVKELDKHKLQVTGHLVRGRPVVLSWIKEWRTFEGETKSPVVETVSGVIVNVDPIIGFVVLEKFDDLHIVSIDSILRINSWQSTEIVKVDTRSADFLKKLKALKGQVLIAKIIDHWVGVDGDERPIYKNVTGELIEFDSKSNFIRLSYENISTNFSLEKLVEIIALKK